MTETLPTHGFDDLDEVTNGPEGRSNTLLEPAGQPPVLKTTKKRRIPDGIADGTTLQVADLEAATDQVEVEAEVDAVVAAITAARSTEA